MRLAIFADPLEEGWPSMDLCADALLERLQQEHPEIQAELFRPRLVKRATRIHRRGFNVDRALTRFWDYPRLCRRTRASYDAFHVVDHSYSQLVHSLPGERTGVFCHDLDTFRCLLGHERRPLWFRAMTRRILAGLQKATLVFCSTEWARPQLGRLVDPLRIVTVPYGVGPEFCPAPPERPDKPYVLHVGSCIARKRIDVLLSTFAALRRELPDLQLIQVGGTFEEEQERQIDNLDVRVAVRQVRGLDRDAIARLYRSASLVLQTSEREGFGLPVVEALACGAPVLASDLPVLREIGADAVVYAPVGDVATWAMQALRIVTSSPELSVPDRETRLARAKRFSWAEHARSIRGAYERLLA